MKMTKLDLLFDIKGLVINDEIEAVFDLITVGFNNYENINDVYVLQYQYKRHDSDYREKNRIVTVLIEMIDNLMGSSDNSLPISMDKSLKIQCILKSPYAIVFDRKKIGFFVNHYHESMPFSFDYFLKEGNLEKAYSEMDFGLLLTVINPFDESFVITNITIKTEYFEQIRSRILRQHGPKGFIEPVELNFIPSKIIGDSVNLLKKGRLYEVLPHNTDRFLLKLDEKADSGFYKIIVSIRVLYQNCPFVLESDTMPLSIQDAIIQNSITLNIAKSHHDVIAQHILELDSQKWDLIKSESENQKNIIYLGQTMVDGKEDKTWKIRKLKKKNITKNGYSIGSDQKSSVVIDLSVPIK
jgi:hypothetical protein